MLKQRILAGLLIAALSLNIHSQIKLSGVYTPLDLYQENYATYEFHSDGSFEFHKGGSLGDSRYGTGEFYIANDSLYLEFNSEPLNIGYHMLKTWDSDRDSIELNLRVFDLNKTPVALANIYYRNITKDDKVLGFTTDETALGTLKLAKDKSLMMFLVNRIGFRNYQFYLTRDLSYDIDIYLQGPGFAVPISKTKLKFIILKNTKDHLILKDLDNNKVTWKKVK